MKDKKKYSKVWQALGLIVTGLAIGVVNGFFGGGGGMLCVPLLLLLGLSNQQAQATAILVMVPISIASACVYYTHGFVDWGITLWVGVGSLIGGILGAVLLKKFNNLTLQYIFTFVVLLAGLKMLF